MSAPLVLPCSFPRPPMFKNDHYAHWGQRYRAERRIHDEALIQAKATRRAATKAGWVVPIAVPVHITLVWTVTTKIRRDASGPQPTLEAWIDGLVDGGLLGDDRHEIVHRASCRIDHGATMSTRVEIVLVPATVTPAPPAA